MELPFRERAYVPREKLVDYLLSPTHPIGRGKAIFFAAFGFDASTADELGQELLAIAQNEPVGNVVASPHGSKYIIVGQIRGLDGRVARVKTVWIIEHGQEQPRLVSAYPAKEEMSDDTGV